jgi:hypothetical protein
MGFRKSKPEKLAHGCHKKLRWRLPYAGCLDSILPKRRSAKRCSCHVRP